MATTSHWDKYELQRLLGRGSFGSAILARDRDSGDLVVVKVQHNNDVRAIGELKTMQKLVHRHIVRFYDAWVESGASAAKAMAGSASGGPLVPANAEMASVLASSMAKGTVCIAMEYCEGGDLRHAIRRRRQTHPGVGFDEPQIRTWLMQLLSALHYCHTQHILHRDLKAENVLIQGDTLKLADFGLCKTLQDTTAFAETRVGSPHYLPPEVYSHSPYNHSADLWCLGILLYELMTLRRPFVADTVAELWDSVINDEPADVAETSQHRYGKDLYRLCRQLLSKNPMKRPTTVEILGETFAEELEKGTVVMCTPSESDAARQEQAWNSILVTAKFDGSSMLELATKDVRLNVRQTPELVAPVVDEVCYGEVVEKIGALYDASGQSWLRLVQGYCIAKNPKPPCQSLFREVPEWRVLRPGQPPRAGSVSVGSGDAASDAGLTATGTVPKAPSTNVEANGEVLAQAALEKRFRSRSQRLQYLMQFLTGHGIDDRLADDLLTRHASMATDADDSAWSVYCCNVLRPIGRVYCLQVLRAAAQQMQDAAKENRAA